MSAPATASAAECGTTAAASGLAKSTACLSLEERDAVRSRLLQTDLMVWALACNGKAEYNAFVIKYRDDLVRDGAQLKATFKRLYGNRGGAELDRFITRLANESSIRRLGAYDFCTTMARVFSNAMSPASTLAEATVAADRVRFGARETAQNR